MRRNTGRKNRRGAAAVEFGLVLPVLLMILLGIIDYGWVFFNQLQMTNAVREGARRGVVEPTSGGALSAADTAATLYLTRAGIPAANVTATMEGTAAAGDLSVRVLADLDPFNPLVGFVPVPAKLTAQAEMRWEGNE